MRVGDLMTRYVDFIDGGATVAEAAEMMGELDVGALPVGSAEELEGIVTNRDILYRLVAKGLNPTEVAVRDVASRPVIGCGEDDSLREAMDVMATHHVRRLPVRDDAGRVIGWITLADLARHLLVESGSLQQTLREITEAPEGLQAR